MKKVDYLIIGFGFAGLSLAERLRLEDKSFAVFDDNSEDASLVAGGIYNPVILKRFNLAWKADEQLDFAIGIYERIEELLKIQFINANSIYRRFNSIEEQNDWFSASDQPKLSEYLDDQLHSSFEHINSEFLFGKVNKTGFLNTKLLIQTYKKYLVDRGLFIQEKFDYTNVDKGKFTYKNYEFKHIVFCEGNGLIQNPYFNYLPLIGNKGEYITIKCSGLQLKNMIKFSLFIIPLGDDLYKVGATYDRNFSDRSTTTRAKDEIVNKLQKIIELPFEVVDQEAGIRPTTKDRRPILGRHPEYDNFYVNNGYGSRGIITAPSAAKWLYNFIEEKEPLPSEVNIARFN